MKITTTKQLYSLEYWEYLGNINNHLVSYGAFGTIKQMNNLISFLKTELQLNHFIPAKKVDGKWVVLEKPDRDLYKDIDGKYDEEHWKINQNDWEKAEKEVLFKGFDKVYYSNNSRSYSLENNNGDQVCFYRSLKDYFIWKHKKIQDLIPLDLELTQNAIDKL